MTKSKAGFTPAEPRPESLTIAFQAETVQLGQLQCDPELQCRAKGTNKRTVSEYAEAMKAGATFPPVVVYRDSKGVLWLADGFHRVAAAELAGLTELPTDVREGGRKEALLFAAKSNGEHGLRRTNADKRRAVLLLLAAFPKLSDRKIGEACGVDNKTVAAARRASLASEEIPQSSDAPTAEQAAPLPDLIRLYWRLVKAHETRPADEHRQAFEAAMAQAFTPNALPVVKTATRRRIVQPAAAASNGAE